MEISFRPSITRGVGKTIALKSWCEAIFSPWHCCCQQRRCEDQVPVTGHHVWTETSDNTVRTILVIEFLYGGRRRVNLGLNPPSGWGRSLWSLPLLPLWWTGDPSRVFPASYPMVAGIISSTPVTLDWISGRGWMDGWEFLLSSVYGQSLTGENVDCVRSRKPVQTCQYFRWSHRIIQLSTCWSYRVSTCDSHIITTDHHFHLPKCLLTQAAWMNGRATCVKLPRDDLTALCPLTNPIQPE